MILQDNWEPALEALVASIGKKFSAAFDRQFCTFNPLHHALTKFA